MDKAFAFLGKAFVVLLVIGAIAGAGYSLGRSGKLALPNDPQPEAASTVHPQAEAPTPTTDIGLTPEKLPQSMKTVTLVSAGLGPDSGLSFTKYQISVPEGWTPSHVTQNEGTWIDTLTVTKGTYELKIFQAATGGALCLYPGDPDFEGPSSRYDLFVSLTTKDGIAMRRGTTNAVNGNKRGFTVCQKSTDSYGQPTGFGHMSYTTPIVVDEATLTEMDEMVKSLKKI